MFFPGRNIIYLSVFGEEETQYIGTFLLKMIFVFEFYVLSFDDAFKMKSIAIKTISQARFHAIM